jgi:2-haloacid dehalogenase
MARLGAIAFDAYGTLLDFTSVSSRLRTLDPETKKKFILVWRSKQLEYTWLRTLMKKYVDFQRVSEDALRYTIRITGLEEKSFESVINELEMLRCFPDVPVALEKLKQKSMRMVILSNGTKGMLNSAIEMNGLQDYFEEVLSVDQVKVYKPDHLVYGLASKYFALEPKSILFVSSNSWDIAGGSSFGFKTVWCNRAGTIFDELGYRPDAEVKELGKLADVVEQLK